MNFKSVAILAASICLVPSALALTDPNLGELSTNDPGAAMNALASGFNYTFSPDAGHGAGGWSAGRPDGHAPIGVMGDHVHKKGEWMVSFRAMRMHMDGMRSGTRRISPNEVFNTQAPGALPGQNFRVTPLEMDTDMYMFGVMHAVTDEWTLMAMVPYLDRSMDHLTAPMLGSQNFTTEAQGLGDIRVSGLRNLHDSDGHRVHLNLGVSVPTGSITERDDTPAMANAKLPYPMQLGTGTWDLLPGLTYLGQGEHWSWGAQGTARLHLGTNSEQYRRGNRIDLTGWLARRVSEAASASLRLRFQSWNEIHGADPDLNPVMIPTANPALDAGDRLDLAAGLNVYASEGSLAGQRIAIEFGVPINQDLEGPQLETDWFVTLGWQLAW